MPDGGEPMPGNETEFHMGKDRHLRRRDFTDSRNTEPVINGLPGKKPEMRGGGGFNASEHYKDDPARETPFEVIKGWYDGGPLPTGDQANEAQMKVIERSLQLRLDELEQMGLLDMAMQKLAVGLRTKASGETYEEVIAEVAEQAEKEARRNAAYKNVPRISGAIKELVADTAHIVRAELYKNPTDLMRTELNLTPERVKRAQDRANDVVWYPNLDWIQLIDTPTDEQALRDAQDTLAKMGSNMGRTGMGLPLPGAGFGGDPMADYNRRSFEAMGLPNPETIGNTPQDWINAVRAFISRRRHDRESEYAQTTWPQAVDTLLSYMKFNGPETQRLKELLHNEARAVQESYKLSTIMQNAVQTSEGIGSLPNTLTGAKVALNPDFLGRLSGLADSTVPEYLRAALRGKERMSMSNFVDRAMWLHAGFLGEWAELQGDALRQAEKIVAKKVRAGKLSGNAKAWDDAAKSEYERQLEVRMKAGSFQALEHKYLGYLGLDTRDGVAPEVVQKIFESMPNKLRTQLEEKAQDEKKTRESNRIKETKGYEKVFKAMQTKGGAALRLHELFGGKNIYSESVSNFDQEFTRYVVAALSGSSYGEELAMDLMISTLEASQLNTTEEATAVASDNVTHMTNPDVRMASEGKKGAPVGSSHVAGRYPPMLNSFLRAEKPGGKQALGVIRSGGSITELDWDSVSRTEGMGYVAITLLRGASVFKTVMSGDIDLKDLGDEGLRSLVKPMNTAWGYWRPSGKERERKNQWELRDEWAKSHLNGKDVKDTQKLGEDEWSPWVTWAVGVTYTHHPVGGLLPEELRSPYGVPVSRADVNQWWTTEPALPQVPTPTSIGELRVKNTRSIREFFDNLYENRLLTENEVRLVSAIMRQGRAQGIPLFGRPKISYGWTPPSSR